MVKTRKTAAKAKAQAANAKKGHPSYKLMVCFFCE